MKYMDLELNGTISAEELLRAAAHSADKESEDDDLAADVSICEPISE